MKNLFMLAASAILLVGCEKDSNTYTLKGEAQGFPDKTQIVVFTFEQGQSRPIDTMVVQNQKFEGELSKTENTALNFLRIENENSPLIFFGENKDLTAIIYKDSIIASRIKGSEQNDSYNKFMDDSKDVQKKMGALSIQGEAAMQEGDAAKIAHLQSKHMNLENEQNELKKNFIKNNNKSLFSLMLMGDLIGKQAITSAEVTSYLDNLDTKIAKHEMTAELRKAVAKMKLGEIDTKAPDFSGPTPEGETLALADVLGKYTIIDFWASWCMPCRVENPNVVKVYKKYHDKGLNIISVSLDRPGARDAWLEAIKKDEMDWFHISNLEFWNDPIAAQYGVRAIPATFLLDENGVIIDKNLRGAALEAKMATLFAE